MADRYGYWLDARTLEQARQYKREVVCRKLQRWPGIRVLDINCGWGCMMRYVTESA